MSRYSQQTSPGVYVSWGWNYTLGFWIDAVNENKNIPEVLFEIQSSGIPCHHPDFPGKSRFSREEILEIMEKYDFIPVEHKGAVAMNLKY